MEMPTILCLEGEESRFAVSSEVLYSGNFRVLSVTNPASALKTFHAVRVDAAVLDCRAHHDEYCSAALRMREMNSGVPLLLVGPRVEKTDHHREKGLIYVSDPHAVVRKLRSLLRAVAASSPVTRVARRSAL